MFSSWKLAMTQTHLFHLGGCCQHWTFFLSLFPLWFIHFLPFVNVACGCSLFHLLSFFLPLVSLLQGGYWLGANSYWWVLMTMRGRNCEVVRSRCVPLFTSPVFFPLCLYFHPLSLWLFRQPPCSSLPYPHPQSQPPSCPVPAPQLLLQSLLIACMTFQLGGWHRAFCTL